MGRPHPAIHPPGIAAGDDARRAEDLPADTLVPLGTLVNVHATRGELRMLPFNPDSQTLNKGCTVILRRGRELQRRVVSALRPHKRFLLLTLAGCDAMSAAEALVGFEVCVPESDLPSTGEHEIYHYQLIGMTAVTTAGVELGTVAEVLTTASNDVCVVRSGSREHLIPLVADIIREIDRKQLRLVVHPLPGLLDG